MHVIYPMIARLEYHKFIPFSSVSRELTLVRFIATCRCFLGFDDEGGEGLYQTLNKEERVKGNMYMPIATHTTPLDANYSIFYYFYNKNNKILEFRIEFDDEIILYRSMCDWEGYTDDLFDSIIL